MDEKKPSAPEVPMQLMNLENLHTTRDDEYDEFQVPTWPYPVRIGSLPASEIISWTEMNEGPEKRTAGLRLIANSLVDNNNQRLVNDGPTRNRAVKILMARSTKSCNFVIDRILTLNDMHPKDKKQQVAEKNGSGEVAMSSSPTVSH